MGIFGKKNKQSPEELRKAREENIAKTSNSLRTQIFNLEKKKDTILRKVMESKQKGLSEQEAQARGLLKRTMAQIKRANGMLMTLELAIESRDLAQLNADFMDSIGTLSEDILSSGQKTSKKKAKQIENKYIAAVYAAGEQARDIDGMLANGDYATAIGQVDNQYSEFDDEIDSMIQSAESSSANMFNAPNRFRN